MFLREEPDARGNRERRSHDPDSDLAPGDFEQDLLSITHRVLDLQPVQITAVIGEDCLDEDQRTTLKERLGPWLSEAGKTTRTILEGLATSGIWRFLLGLT